MAVSWGMAMAKACERAVTSLMYLFELVQDLILLVLRPLFLNGV